MKSQRYGLAIDVCLWLVAHPGRVLFSADIIKDSGKTQSAVWQSLDPLVRGGWLIRSRKPNEMHNHYAAGPNIEAALGRWV